ncbi:MAG: preprotein translocase subunit SecG [Candidatus Zambryskibacteria bacterium CG_4_9_14_3_um_filter_40_16]|uniref:Protein-export membrane protein SecG n=1 Tax=Candidatus Zambryskibacteria bacterium CG_4_9_14_3_um_filter_40_16 TaxID=1975111 RepID=A0A2M7WTY3_9BACT|nr:MAG: preprotein translocase subunit SecG [Candidatus Zambryskibacteria bacterium CG_4_9_14_3_um_filter_40_16]
MSISGILPYVQIILSVILIGSILLQTSDAGLGSAFGGGDSFSSGHHERRGFEKTIFRATIITAILFGFSTFISLFI